jgi:hypothetical protein
VSDLEDQPHIGSFIQADFAEAVNGKLYLMGGGFDTVWAPHFPWDVRFFFGAIVFVPWKDTNRRLPVEGRVVSSDGEDLGWNLDGELEAGRAPGQRGGRSSLVIAGPVAFRVEEPIKFAVKLRFASDERSIPLSVDPLPFPLGASPSLPAES